MLVFRTYRITLLFKAYIFKAMICAMMWFTQVFQLVLVTEKSSLEKTNSENTIVK